MLIQVCTPADCHQSLATAESTYLSRRTLVGAMGLGTAAMTLPRFGRAESGYADVAPDDKVPQWLRNKLEEVGATRTATDEAITPFPAATQYNNFYEFGPEKGDPARHAG